MNAFLLFIFFSIFFIISLQLTPIWNEIYEISHSKPIFTHIAGSDLTEWIRIWNSKWVSIVKLKHWYDTHHLMQQFALVISLTLYYCNWNRFNRLPHLLFLKISLNCGTNGWSLLVQWIEHITKETFDFIAKEISDFIELANIKNEHTLCASRQQRLRMRVPDAIPLKEDDTRITYVISIELCSLNGFSYFFFRLWSHHMKV